MKNTSTITSKGQVTVPIAIRKKLGLHKGDQVEFVQQKQGMFVRRKPPEDDPFKKYQGILKGTFKSAREINEWIHSLRENRQQW